MFYLERQALIATKNRTLKCLKWHYLTYLSKPTTVSEQFLSHSNYSHTDMQLIPLEKILACENSRFSSLLAAGDVSRGGIACVAGAWK